MGGSGQIGAQAARACAAAGWPVAWTHHRNALAGGIPLDASDPAQVMDCVERLRPRLIINSVNAEGGTDACEAEPGLAERVHLASARHVIDAARAVGAALVQLSTDYVFDGQAGPYDEAAAPRPLSRLGRAKLEAERYALARIPGALVLRTSFVFSWAPQARMKNFAMQILERLREGQAMRVPLDQVGNVTYAPNLAEALVELAGMGASGVFHVAGPTRCSKYDWARRTAAWFGLDPALIRGVPTAELGQAGPRPLQSGFRLDKAQAMLRTTRLMTLEEGLADMARAMGSVEAVR